MIYVDDMYTVKLGQFGRMKMSHMWSPDVEELHKMADSIGLDRKHFQIKNQFMHYDVSMSLRAKAVSLGAKEVTMRELARLVRDYRNAINCKEGGQP